jgi:hypothetical protein
MCTVLNDALKRAQEIHRQSRQEQAEKRKSRPVTTNGFIQYFYDLYEKHDYGTPLPLKKDTRNKVSGFVRLLKNNGYEDKDIYGFLEQVFEKWPQFKQKRLLTNNKKTYILSDTPDLQDMIVCRDSILRELQVQKEPQQKKSLLEQWRES